MLSISRSDSALLAEPQSEPVTHAQDPEEAEERRRESELRAPLIRLSASEPQVPTVRIQPPHPSIDPDPSGSNSPPLASELARLVISQSAPLPAVRLKAKQRYDNSSSSLSLPSFHAQPAGQPSASIDQTRYRIGSRTVAGSLVSAESIKAHLGLLAAFKRLRQRVESCPDESLPDIAQFLDGPQRWAWFVGLAVERCVQNDVTAGQKGHLHPSPHLGFSVG